MKKKKTNHCVTCDEVKPIEEFLKGKRNIDPLYCNDCRVYKTTDTKKYYQANKEKFIEYTKNWRLANREKKNETQRTYQNSRYKEDTLFNLTSRLRSRTLSAFKAMNMQKNTKTKQLLGCEYVELKEHIEKKFTDGMSWDNKSEWHIDHIIPLSSAKNEKELYKLCHYKNLQPLWAKDNLSKGKKLLKNF